MKWPLETLQGAEGILRRRGRGLYSYQCVCISLKWVGALNYQCVSRFEFYPYSETLTALIQKYFTQLTNGCGDRRCDNPDCATASGHPLDPTTAALRAVTLVRNKGRLCKAFSSPSTTISTNNLTVSSSRLASSSECLSLVRQEEGAGSRQSESTVPHSSTVSLPQASEPMELALSPTATYEHLPDLVIGSSSSSIAQQYSRDQSSTSSSSVSQTTSSQTTSSDSTYPSDSSAASLNPLLNMAANNMLTVLDRMEVSPSLHPPHPSTSSSSTSSSTISPIKSPPLPSSSRGSKAVSSKTSSFKLG